MDKRGEVVWRMRGVRKVKEDLFMSVYDIGTEQHFFETFIGLEMYKFYGLSLSLQNFYRNADFLSRYKSVRMWFKYLPSPTCRSP